jgi:hypothetical protein
MLPSLTSRGIPVINFNFFYEPCPAYNAGQGSGKEELKGITSKKTLGGI